MSGFVSSPPPSAPGDPVDAVASDDFWPPVSLVEARDVLRLPSVVTDARLRAAIRAGMMFAYSELRAWKAGHVAAGAVTHADIEGETIDGISALALLYERAVLSIAAADLAETHLPVSATADGRKQTDGEVLTAGDHRRNAIHAIRDIRGVRRTLAELI